LLQNIKPTIYFSRLFYYKTTIIRYISMVILKPENTIHEITIIPRLDSGVIAIVMKNESKNTVETFYNIPTVFSFGYLTFEIEKTVEEKESFEYSVYSFDELTADTTIFSADSTLINADMTLYLGNNLLFRGKAFATNQIDLQNYKINN